MRFRLQEKFSKNIPTEIKIYLTENRDLIEYLTHTMGIDLYNASCDKISLKTTKDREDFIEYLNDVYEDGIHAIFIIFKDLSIYCAPRDFYDKNGNNILTYCEDHPEKIDSVYALYNDDIIQKNLSNKQNSREANNYSRAELHSNGMLRSRDYYDSVYNVDQDTMSYDYDKSGYAIIPDKLQKDFVNFLKENGYKDYAHWVDVLHTMIMDIGKVISSHFREIDLDIDSDVSHFRYLLDDYALIVHYYNKMINEIEKCESIFTGEDLEFHIKNALDYHINRLYDRIKSLQKQTNKVRYVDFEW